MQHPAAFLQIKIVNLKKIKIVSFLARCADKAIVVPVPAFEGNKPSASNPWKPVSVVNKVNKQTNYPCNNMSNRKNETEYWPQTLIFIIPKLYNPDVAYIIIFKHECKNLTVQNFTENMSFWREISSKVWK